MSYLPDLSFIFITIVFVFVPIRALYRQFPFILLVGFIRAVLFQVFLLLLTWLFVLIFPFSEIWQLSPSLSRTSKNSGRIITVQNQREAIKYRLEGWKRRLIWSTGMLDLFCLKNAASFIRAASSTSPFISFTPSTPLTAFCIQSGQGSVTLWEVWTGCERLGRQELLGT